MPLITMPNPLTAASEAVGGYTEQAERNKAAALALATLRQRQQAEQEKLDMERQNAEATNAYRTAQMGMEQKRFALEQTRAGIDPGTSKPIAPPPAPTPPPAPQPTPQAQTLSDVTGVPAQVAPVSKTDVLKGAAIGLPKEMAGTPLYQQAIDSIQKASELSGQADYYFKAGAIDVGNNLLTRAREARDEAHQYVLMANELNKDARDFEKFSATVAHQHAQEAHWTRQDKQKADSDAKHIAVMIQHNEITREVGVARILATYAGIDSANARHTETLGESHRHNIATEGNAGRTAKLAIDRFNASAANNLQKQQYSATISQWLLSGGTTPMPQPPVPTTIGSGGAGSGAASQLKTKVNPANGKTYYLHADGNYYLTP